MNTTEEKRKEVISYTNTKLVSWYINAKSDYNVTGSGQLRFTEDSAIIEYIENGQQKTWSMAFYPEYLQEQKIDWVYNCWMELA